MDGIEKLEQEHQLILKYLDLGQQLITKSQQLSLESTLHVAKNIVDFIKEFADHYHHAKEEDVLFQYMGEPGTLTHCNPISQMLHEHDLGRSFVAQTIEGIEKKDSKLICTNLNNYCQLLQQHIYKEDHILYPMARKSIPEDRMDVMENDFANVEQTFTERNLEKKYTNLLEQLTIMLNQ